MITFTCAYCNGEGAKRNKAVRRALVEGRKLYCSRACSTRAAHGQPARMPRPDAVFRMIPPAERLCTLEAREEGRAYIDRIMAEMHAKQQQAY